MPSKPWGNSTFVVACVGVRERERERERESERDVKTGLTDMLNDQQGFLDKFLKDAFLLFFFSIRPPPGFLLVLGWDRWNGTYDAYT